MRLECKSEINNKDFEGIDQQNTIHSLEQQIKDMHQAHRRELEDAKQNHLLEINNLKQTHSSQCENTNG